MRALLLNNFKTIGGVIKMKLNEKDLSICEAIKAELSDYGSSVVEIAEKFGWHLLPFDFFFHELGAIYFSRNDTDKFCLCIEPDDAIKCIEEEICIYKDPDIGRIYRWENYSSEYILYLEELLQALNESKETGG
jgi:hypothetical protein